MSTTDMSIKTRNVGNGRRLAGALAACAFAWSAGVANAQLAEDQVLVIYDSRVPDSVAVAEYYAGSRKVPGGVGNLAGVRPGVNVVNMAAIGAGFNVPGNVSELDFRTKIRDPLRTYLSSNNLTFRIRALVTTKGLPHRLFDTDVPQNADFPGTGANQFIPELTANDCTSASVEAELALLWQDLTQGELGNGNDSRADGLIVNPYWRQTRGINTFSNVNITANKPLSPAGTGPTWSTSGAAGAATRLNPADMYLVTRLDGTTVANVRAMIDRSQNTLINTNTAALLFDEDGADFDNVAAGSAAFPALLGGDDYEDCVTALTNDRRFSFAFPSPPANVRYDNNAGAANFFVGPQLAFAAGQGILISNPVLYLATYGSNHSGVPSLAAGGSSGTVYAASYNYAPGAIFNTIESFNGRDFGGLGQLGFAPQQQATDFLASGGTFALCNVWEPLADSVPDNLPMVQQFVLGNVSFAEAAWLSIPALSWMQMPVGDPLARMMRSNENLSGDARVSADDLYAWEALPGANASKDVNRSGTADTTDRNVVAGSVRAAERVNVMSRR